MKHIERLDDSPARTELELIGRLGNRLKEIIEVVNQQSREIERLQEHWHEGETEHGDETLSTRPIFETSDLDEEHTTWLWASSRAISELDNDPYGDQ